MKRKIHILVALFVTFFVQSQTYVPLLDNINEWQLTNCYSGCVTDIYYTDGDTIVDGKSYKILDGFHFISRKFLLREDVPERKIYLNFIESTHSAETLLYDFSLSEGDSINIRNPISPFPTNGGYFLLDSIRNVVSNGENHKKFFFSPTPSNPFSTGNAIWVEGVGSLSMINAPGGEPNINGAGHLSCYFKNAELYYSNLDSIDGCSPSVLDIQQNLAPIEAALIFENGKPFLVHSENVSRYQIFDLSGKRIVSENNNGSKIIDLQTAKLLNGIYILVVENRNSQKKNFKLFIN
ncbi:T9SS type A sorting domain-containing protein [Aequorivita echinoideorum]|uniref:T9SS type A sorting domain-containing protein n=1 Tax=Aequorivita echinoideorum TaxID=1549647 RepID=A0ABS5S8H0_9FLAO|nr:T9SS type A sorting domain-containing protein [Aequorivita echinoideorum]MBT0608729.1 T9SS type A sorting domain-containing protein [Aequorivita echinoideorum]